MDLSAMDYKNMVGLGECSHGTREFQQIRLRILKHLASISPIQVFIEANYLSIERIKAPGATRQEFQDLVSQSNLFHHLRSKEFFEILWWLHSKRIPFFGVDPNINPAEPSINPTVEWLKSATGNRSAEMLRLIGLLWDPATRGVFIAHNYHISSYVGFKGTSIAMATIRGSVTIRAEDTGLFVASDFDYSTRNPPQQLQSNKIDILSTPQTKKWFYNVGESGEPEQMRGDKFSYVIIVPKTHALTFIR